MKFDKLVDKLFENADKAIKVLCKITFAVSLVGIVGFFIAYLSVSDIDHLFCSLYWLVACISTLISYAFADILTQLKLLNQKNK